MREIAAITVILLGIFVTFVATTSDPRSEICDSVCWEEEVQVEECIDTRTCSLGPNASYQDYRACRRPCWRIAVPCRRMCRRRYAGVLNTCVNRPDSTGRPTRACVLDVLMRNKHR
ncbi:transposase [Plakobranchus ocellatus]|uniref:Transposase n=1 Tax=Plakobranchus ocellatus TaxID=259542 RepID=A0AAV4AKC0_9GAST|nr:transposase [Plakobranchus ocellatus]